MGNDSQKNLFGGEDLPPLSLPWEEVSDRLSAEIVFDLPLELTFHYLVPEELQTLIEPGQRVRAPFGRGNRPTVGYCVSLGPPPQIRHRLKEIAEIIDRDPLFSPPMLDLTKWIAAEYLCGWGQVLQSVVPAGVKKKAGTRLIQHYQPAPEVCQKLVPELLSPKQRAVMEILCRTGEPMRIEDLTDAAQCGTGPINALRNKGLIQAVRKRTETASFQSDQETPITRMDDLRLNPAQRQALDTILQIVRSGQHRTVLLHGVTGSGKTEIYIQAIREIVSYGRQAIVLVPEISLTPQTIRRFRQRFDSVAVLHSHLSDAERHWHWQQIARGAVQVVVGARSAIFAPTPHLGMIVIDEEHETSFKQEITPRYHAREVARQRAMRENVPLILGSATPTLESWYRVQQKKDILISLPSRVEDRPLPPVVIVDIRNDPQHPPRLRDRPGAQPGDPQGDRGRRASHSVSEPAGPFAGAVVPGLRRFAQVSELRHHLDLAQRPERGALPCLRLRMPAADALPDLRAGGNAIFGHRHAAIGSRGAGEVSRCLLPADGQRRHAKARQPR